MLMEAWLAKGRVLAAWYVSTRCIGITASAAGAVPFFFSTTVCDRQLVPCLVGYATLIVSKRVACCLWLHLGGVCVAVLVWEVRYHACLPLQVLVGGAELHAAGRFCSPSPALAVSP
jgi:hypothetical protein